MSGLAHSLHCAAFLRLVTLMLMMGSVALGQRPPSIATPGDNPVGLAWDGEYLWLSDAGDWGDQVQGRIYRIHSPDDDWEACIEWPTGKWPGPIAYDPGLPALWVIDEESSSITAIAASCDDSLSVIQVQGQKRIEIPYHARRPGQTFTGLTFNKSYGALIASMGGGLCATCFVFPTDFQSPEDHVLGSYFPVLEPRGMALGNGYLWTVGYNSPKRPGVSGPDPSSRLSRRTFTMPEVAPVTPAELLREFSITLEGLRTSQEILDPVEAIDPTGMEYAEECPWPVGQGSSTETEPENTGHLGDPVGCLWITDRSEGLLYWVPEE